MSQGPSKRRPPKLPASGTPEPAPPPSVPPTPSPPDVAEPSKLRQFLDQAASVVAAERGLGARSHVKLAAIAHSLGLNDDEFQQAMQSLQGRVEQRAPTADELSQQRRRERMFQNYVGETLSALPQGVLTASMQHMLISTGVEQYALTSEDAERHVVDLAQKLRVRRITADEAQRHLEGLIDLAMVQRGSLTDDVRLRIQSEASRWGLTPDQVAPLINERVRHAHRTQSQRQRRRVVLLSMSAALTVAVVGSLGIWGLLRAFPSNRSQDPAVATNDPETSNLTAATRATDGSGARPIDKPMDEPPAWWNEDVQLSVALTAARIPAYRDTLYSLRSPQEDRRCAAYAELFDRLQRDELTRDQYAMLTKLFASTYALEPSEVCAAAVRRALLETASGPREGLAESILPWDIALWAGDTTAAMLLHEDLPDARASALAADFHRNFQATLELETPARLTAQIDAAIAGRLYETLAKRAQAQPELAVDIHLRLLPLIDGLLDAAARDRLQTDYLTAVLPALGDRWVIYEDLIRRSVYSDDPLNVLKMLELCERTTDLALQGYLATQLTLRTGLPRTARTMPELVAAVREALGATAAVRPLDNKERLAQWREAATAALGKPLADGRDTTAALQQLVELTRLSTLGSALAQGELGSAEFDALWHDSTPMLKASRDDESPARAGPRLNTTQFKDLSRSTAALRGYSRLSKLQRMNYIRAVKHYEDSLPDVQPAQGQDIAIYLTAAKAVDEHEMLMTLVDGLLEWKMVRLGLADALAESRLREEHLLQLVSKALKREVKAELGWRDQARISLLADVARELDAAVSFTGESEGVEHQASRLAMGYLRLQAKLAGVKEDELKATTSPSDLFKLLTGAAGARLSSSSSPAARQLAERLPQELSAIDYLATSDMTRMALLQRLLVKLMAAEIENGKSGVVGRVTSTQTELTNADMHADHVLDQLLAGQRALLELWLVRNE